MLWAAIGSACGAVDSTSHGRIILAMESGEVSAFQHLWVVDGDGRLESLIQITEGAVVDEAPRWSPDQRFVAFDRSAPRTRGLDLRVRVRELSTGSEQEVPAGAWPEGLRSDGRPFWSRDGGLLGFERTLPGVVSGARLGSARLWLVPIVRGPREWVLGGPFQTSPQEGLSRSNADWGRPGEIVFQQELTVSGPVRWGVGVQTFPGGRETTVLAGGCCERHVPRVAPDEERLAYLESESPARTRVMVSRVNGADATQVVCDGEWLPTSWSPDGRQLLLVPRDRPPSLWIVDVPVLGGPCAPPRQLIRLPHQVSSADWVG